MYLKEKGKNLKNLNTKFATLSMVLIIFGLLAIVKEILMNRKIWIIIFVIQEICSIKIWIVYFDIRIWD